MATAIKHFSGSVGSTGGTSINWTNEDADLDLCLGNELDKAKNLTGLTNNHDFIRFKPDGTKIFLGTDGNTDGIVAYDLATAWDIESTLTNETKYNYLGPLGYTTNTTPNFIFNDDGTQFLAIVDNGRQLYYYTCSTAYDLSTASNAGEIEEFDAGQTTMVGLTWTNSGKTLIVSNQSSENQYYTASTAYDFSTLKFRAEKRTGDFNSGNTMYIPTGSFPGGVFGNDTNNIILQHGNTTAYNNTVSRVKALVPDYPQTTQLLDTQITVNAKLGSNVYPYFTRTGDYMYWIDIGGNWTTGYSGNDWIFRAPTSHSVAADTTIYTVPTGKVAKVTMNMAGQSANVYAGGSKIAQLKGGSAIRHTQRGHTGYTARHYLSDGSGNPNIFPAMQAPCVTFYARGGTPLNMGLYSENLGPDFFMLAAGESLVLKNSVNVNFDIQVIEDNASS